MRYSEERVQEIFDATIDLLGEKDYRRLTMMDLARRCQVSKETLYRWFGNKSGLFAAIIKARSARIVEEIQTSMAGTDDDPPAVLRAFCRQYLRTVLSEGAVRLNRVAISGVQETPELAQLLVDNGRENALPPLKRYLGTLQDRGLLETTTSVDDLAEALLGLAAGDKQIRRLLNAMSECPASDELDRLAAAAVHRFLRAFGNAARKEDIA